MLFLIAGCPSIPQERKRIDQIAAVGWLNDNEPIAIAQDMTFYRGWYPLTPEGPGVFKTITCRDLGLLTLDKRITVSFSPGRRFWLKHAAFVPSLSSFVVIVSVETPGTLYDTYRCLIVAKDGSYRDCHLPESLNFFKFSPDARELFIEQSLVPSDNDPNPYAYDYITDTSRDLPGTLPLSILPTNIKYLPAWVPCKVGFYQDRLSPDSSILAFRCPNGSGQQVIWIADESGNPRQVIQIENSDLHLQYDEFDADADQLYHHYASESLAWSPDQRYLYFCMQPGSTGYVIALDGTPQPNHYPGLIAAEWSPNGTKIAGILDNKLTVWTPELLR